MRLLLIIGIITLRNELVQAQRRIYSAVLASEGMLPYMAYVAYRNETFLECGASVIHQRWLLTAGHCILEYVGYPTVTVGTTMFQGLNGDIYNVVNMYVHANFEVLPEHLNGGLEYIRDDIGLLRTDRDIVFDYNVKPIQLARDVEDKYTNHDVVIAGWGREVYNGKTRDQLQYSIVPILSNRVCRGIWTYITNKYLCTSNSISGVCYADSGGPVVLHGFQIGIISSTDKYCKSLKPDLHTRVSFYADWIDEILAIHGDVLLSIDD